MWTRSEKLKIIGEDRQVQQHRWSKFTIKHTYD